MFARAAFNLACGSCRFCARGLHSNDDYVNPNATAVGAIYGYSHTAGGSRFGRRRADVGHQALDPVVVAGPWIAAGAAAYAGVRTLRRRRA